jgi:hypothetical protein
VAPNITVAVTIDTKIVCKKGVLIITIVVLLAFSSLSYLLTTAVAAVFLPMPSALIFSATIAAMHPGAANANRQATACRK